MAQTSTKFSIVPPQTEKSPSNLEVDNSLTVDADPTRDIRALIEQLQESSSDARVLLRKAEDERDALAAKLGRLQLELDSANELAKNAREISTARDRLLSERAADFDTIADLTSKFEACERLRAEAAKQRDDLIRQTTDFNQQKAVLLKQSEEATRQRDALKKSDAESKAKVDEQKRRLAEVEQHLAGARKRASELERELAEARKNNTGTAKNERDSLKQIAALKQARDAATACVAELKSKVASLEDQVADLSYERDASARKDSSSAKQAPLIAGDLENVRKEAAKEAARAQEASEKVGALQAAIGEISAERDELVKQNSVLIEERDAARKAPPVSARTSSPLAKNESAASIAEKYESQRMVTIELSAMLEKAQREIKEMGASLAEARLMLKSADRRGPVAQKSVPQSAARKAKTSAEKLPEAPASRETIHAMAESIEAFSRTRDSEPLNELFTHAQALADQAEIDQARVLHRVSSSLASLLHELYLMPEQVTESVIQTVEDSIGFLTSVQEMGSLDEIVKMDGVRVYVVDDDQGVCEAVASSIRAVGLSVRTTQLPGEALSELAGNPYDLLVLDVHLPELDGFDLCANIRSMELHAETPVIFLSGDGSMQNRVQSSMCGGNDFVSKPFNFCEMGLKILVRILRAQLNIL